MSQLVLSPALAEHAFFTELCTILEEEFARLPLDRLLVYLMDLVQPSLLPILAEQFHLMEEEGWDLAVAEQAKRELLKQSIALHRYKGTRWSLTEIFRILGIDVDLVEWWQTTPAKQPHTFSLTAWINSNLDSGEQILNAALYQRLHRMIQSIKPVRAEYHFAIGAKFNSYPALTNVLQTSALSRIPARLVRDIAKLQSIKLSSVLYTLPVARCSMEIK